ncbi:MAG: hypothetical protein ABH848_02420 [Candidatus Omnitrophota bacterium]
MDLSNSFYLRKPLTANSVDGQNRLKEGAAMLNKKGLTKKQHDLLNRALGSFFVIIDEVRDDIGTLTYNEIKEVDPNEDLTGLKDLKVYTFTIDQLKEALEGVGSSREDRVYILNNLISHPGRFQYSEGAPLATNLFILEEYYELLQELPDRLKAKWAEHERTHLKYIDLSEEDIQAVFPLDEVVNALLKIIRSRFQMASPASFMAAFPGIAKDLGEEFIRNKWHDFEVLYNQLSGDDKLMFFQRDFPNLINAFTPEWVKQNWEDLFIFGVISKEKVGEKFGKFLPEQKRKHGIKWVEFQLKESRRKFGLMGKLFIKDEQSKFIHVKEGITSQEKDSFVYFYKDREKLYTKDSELAKVELTGKEIETESGEKIKIIKDNKYIRGFSDGGSTYLVESLANNPVARFHEERESYYANHSEELPVINGKRINPHTFLIGLGKQARREAKKILNIREITAEKLITYLKEKLPKDRWNEAEFNLIKYNASQGRTGIELVYGEQDFNKDIGPEANEKFSNYLASEQEKFHQKDPIRMSMKSIDDLPSQNPSSDEYIVLGVCVENLVLSVNIDLALSTSIAKNETANIRVESAGIRVKNKSPKKISENSILRVVDYDNNLFEDVKNVAIDKMVAKPVSPEVIEKASLIIVPYISSATREKFPEVDIKKQLLERFGYIEGLEDRIFTPIELSLDKWGLTRIDIQNKGLKHINATNFKNLLVLFDGEFIEKLEQVSNTDTKINITEANNIKTADFERKEEVEALLQEIEKEIEAPGTGKLPKIAIMTDIHGAIIPFFKYIEDIISRETGKKITLDHEIFPQVSIKEQLSKQNIDITKIKRRFQLLGDAIDRGPYGIKCFKVFKEFTDLGLCDGPIIGNHELWALLNIMGFGFPIYKGFNFYGHTASEELVEKHWNDPDIKENRFRWWAKKLIEYNKAQEELQRGVIRIDNEDKYIADIREDLKGKYLNIKDQLSEDEKKLWEDLVGFYPNTLDNASMGFNGIGVTSVEWWGKRLKVIRKGLRNSKAKGNSHEINMWDALKEYTEGAIKLVQKRLKKAIKEGKWQYQVFNDINDGIGTTPEWAAMDWLLHWGTSLIDELNEIEGEEKWDQENYMENPYFQEFVSFTRENFTLYQKDLLGNLYTHALLPIDTKNVSFIYKGVEYGDEGIFEGLKLLKDYAKDPEPFDVNKEEPDLIYNGKEYQGDDVSGGLGEILKNIHIRFTYKGITYEAGRIFEGLDAIQNDVRDFKKPLSELQEAFTLINSWYVDETVKIKPKNIKNYIDAIGLDAIFGNIGIWVWFTGHNPINRLHERGIGFKMQDEDAVLFSVDKGMNSEKYKDTGGYGDLDADGIRLRGFDDPSFNEIIDNPDTMLLTYDESEKQIVRNSWLNKPLEKEEFLKIIKTQLKSELDSFKTSVNFLPDIPSTGLVDIGVLLREYKDNLFYKVVDELDGTKRAVVFSINENDEEITHGEWIGKHREPPGAFYWVPIYTPLLSDSYIDSEVYDFIIKFDEAVYEIAKLKANFLELDLRALNNQLIVLRDNARNYEFIEELIEILSESKNILKEEIGELLRFAEINFEGLENVIIELTELNELDNMIQDNETLPKKLEKFHIGLAKEYLAELAKDNEDILIYDPDLKERFNIISAKDALVELSGKNSLYGFDESIGSYDFLMIKSPTIPKKKTNIKDKLNNKIILFTAGLLSALAPAQANNESLKLEPVNPIVQYQDDKDVITYTLENIFGEGIDINEYIILLPVDYNYDVSCVPIAKDEKIVAFTIEVESEELGMAFTEGQDFKNLKFLYERYSSMPIEENYNELIEEIEYHLINAYLYLANEYCADILEGSYPEDEAIQWVKDNPESVEKAKKLLDKVLEIYPDHIKAKSYKDRLNNMVNKMMPLLPIAPMGRGKPDSLDDTVLFNGEALLKEENFYDFWLAYRSKDKKDIFVIIAKSESEKKALEKELSSMQLFPGNPKKSENLYIGVLEGQALEEYEGLLESGEAFKGFNIRKGSDITKDSKKLRETLTNL